MLKKLFLACLGFIELENLGLQSIFGEPNFLGFAWLFHRMSLMCPWRLEWSHHIHFPWCGVLDSLSFFLGCELFLVIRVEPSVGGALNGPSSDNITFRWFSSLQTSTKASTIVQNETRLKTRPRPSSRSWFNPTPVLSQDSVSALHRLHIPSFRQETNPILATYPLG